MVQDQLLTCLKEKQERVLDCWKIVKEYKEWEQKTRACFVNQ
jgi:hypothetical protein